MTGTAHLFSKTTIFSTMKRFLPLFVLLLTAVLSSAQDNKLLRVAVQDTSQQLLITTNKDSLLGRALEYVPPEFTFLLSTGDTLFFDESDLLNIASPPSPITITEPKPIPFSIYQDLFTSTSAFSMPARNIQARNTQLLWNQVNFSATDHYTIGTGYVLPFYLLLKTKFASNNTESNFNMAAGLNILFALVSDQKYPRGVHLYTAATIGKPDRYINFNAGYALDLSGGDRFFLLSGGGLFPISQRWNILLDHLLIFERNNKQFLPGIGVSYANNKHRIDFGYFYYTTFSTPIVSLPGVGYTMNF